MSDEISTIETYRGVGIHDNQPQSRIEGVVKPEIDRVHAMRDAPALFAFACAPLNCPEARLLAAARCEAAWELAAENREVRPNVDLVKLRAFVAGLDSAGWRDPYAYTTLLDPRHAVQRDEPLE
jgi:hypothetical protein